MDLLALVDEHFMKALGLTEVRLSPADPNEQRMLAERGQERFTITPIVVAGRSAGAFKGWVKYNAAEMRRIRAEKPKGWYGYTMMVGMAPDDETPWWVAMYDEAIIREAVFEDMGGWFRSPPEEVAQALVAPGILDLVQMALFPPDSQVVQDLAYEAKQVTRATVKSSIDQGIASVMDREQIKHLDGEYLDALVPRLLEAAKEATFWSTQVRQKQSYSLAKAQAKKGR